MLARLILGGLAAVLAGVAARAADVSCTPSSAARLEVTVTGVLKPQGLVTVTLYSDDKSKFLKHHGSIGTVRTPAQSPITRLCMPLPGPGRYALAVYHDQNGDRKLNRNFLLPAEPFALSNNPPPRMAWPALEPSLFSTHAGENSVHVSLEKAPKKDAQKPS